MSPDPPGDFRWIVRLPEDATIPIDRALAAYLIRHEASFPLEATVSEVVGQCGAMHGG